MELLSEKNWGKMRQFIGKRHLRKFIIDTARKELIRLKQKEALKMAAGFLRLKIILKLPERAG